MLVFNFKSTRVIMPGNVGRDVIPVEKRDHSPKQVIIARPDVNPIGVIPIDQQTNHPKEISASNFPKVRGF